MKGERLREAIDQLISNHQFSQLTKAATELSVKYRSASPSYPRFISTEADRLAYLAVRMPATFSAALAVFSEIRRLVPEFRIRTLLDLGAGPGTAAWAAVEIFDEIEQIGLLEQDHELVELGRSLASGSDHASLQSADWVKLNLELLDELPSYDLVVCSYSLGELRSESVSRVLKAAWEAARQIIVIVEPGTVKGFELIRSSRETLIEAAGHVIAPCPHQNACPMAEQDWCHFAERFERTSLHRRVKSGSLGYEDEKFSYIAVSKESVEPVKSRVIRHPLKYSGYIQIQLCARQQIEKVTITRSDKERWRRARKLGWGDEW